MSLLPGTFNFQMVEGDTFRAVLDVTDSAGDPVSFAGKTVSAQARRTYGASTAVNFGVSVSSNEITLTLTAEQSSSMEGSWVYDVQVVTPGTSTRTILAGVLEVQPEVTRA